MNLIDIWVVYQGGSDMSSGEPGFFYTDERIARAKSKGNGWYGGDAKVEKRKAVRVGNKHYLIDDIGEIDLDDKVAEEKARLVKKAKAKLTDAELDALIGDSDK